MIPRQLTPEQTTQAIGTGGQVFTWVAANAGFAVFVCPAFIILLGRLKGRRRDASQAAKALKGGDEQLAKSQGRLPADELVRNVKMPRGGAGIPLGYAPRGWPWRPKVAGVTWRKAVGHVGIFGPIGTGKGFHATDTLLRWPGSALVVDPKSEQYERTAGTRKQYGDIYRIPDSGFDLAALFDLGNPLARRELFEALLRPHLDRDPFWLERVYPLFEAAYLTAKATNRHPLHLFARWSRMAPGNVLGELAPYAPGPLNMIAAGLTAESLSGDRTFGNSWTSFTSRLAPIAEQLRYLALSPALGGIPVDWAEQRATVYLNFPIHAQGAVGPIVAALVAGVLRRLEAHPPKHRTLLCLDEAPTVGLPRLSNYLATIRGERGGVTALVYCQSISQLEAVYGRAESEATMSNFSAGQMFFPPRDLTTAQYLSRLFGEELEPTVNASGSEQVGVSQGRGQGRSYQVSSSTSWSVSTHYRRALTEAQALAMPEGTVAVFAAGKRAMLTDSRTVLVRRLAKLPRPEVPASTDDGPPAPLPPPARATITEIPRLAALSSQQRPHRSRAGAGRTTPRHPPPAPGPRPAPGHTRPRNGAYDEAVLTGEHRRTVQTATGGEGGH